MSYEMNFGKAYNDQLPTLGDTMTKVIRFFGGKHIYGVGGDFAANIIAALDETIDICPSSNEMHAGFSACAQAEIDGMGFCLTTYMVGSLPCTSAAALAVTESLPVVFISGAQRESEVNQLALHHTIHPNASWKAEYDNALKAFSALGVRVERLQGQRLAGHPNLAGQRFYQLVAQAYKNKQPVFIEVPRDQVFAKTQPIQLPANKMDVCCGGNILTGSSLIVDAIVSRLEQAKKPLIYIGDGLKHNDQLKQLIMQFANKFNIPYATSWFAKGLFDEYAPLSLGSYNGVFTQTCGRAYIDNEVDYIIDVATSIIAQDSNVAFATGTHKVETFENKTILKGGDRFEKDLIEVFEQLLTRDISVFDFTINQQDKLPIPFDDLIDFNNLADTLNEIQAQQSMPLVYLPEVGNSYFASYSLKVRGSILGRSWLTNPWYGAMGTALPYARVVAQRLKEQQAIDANRQERAVVIVGDGGFHFQLNELIHFLKDKSDVTIIYMRNNIFHLGKNGDGKIYHCNDEKFDVHSLVAAYQGHSKTCTTVADFTACFVEFQQCTGVSLIEVLADPVESKQSNEMRLLNLYIKAKNGQPEAIAQWSALTE
ncbi:thiamine pyrophosphate-dependent enzyme [Colwellia sp. MSW7]|uniref:pyruvate decarboxylase n=1 Tax=Colwellia maritima TaxID=2912588 RepID=A0ABS9WZA1_9GAMM|nr:thiamine pyrophosphate-dependent enzyme [Colwellia maritima]MCI2283239.1 thiamine pyrophosphate-dependent enzyme [Colwellia maritima]